MLFPMLMTWVYFVVLAGRPGMKVAYTVGKLIQFSLPVVWLALVERPAGGFVRGVLREAFQDGTNARTRRRWVFASAAFGLLVVAAMFLTYAALRTSPLLAAAPGAVLEKLHQIGADRPLPFLALAGFYSLAHSFLEESYWRWFVFGRLRDLSPVPVAILLSSLGFMAHHVILLAVYFGGTWWLAALLSAGVAAGGAVWALLYERSGSLLGPWISHLIVDAGLMAVGFVMVRPLL